MPKILAINAGSSTLKWKLFAMPEERVLASGLIDRLGQAQATVKIKFDDQKLSFDQPIKDFHEAVVDVMERLKDLHLVAHLHEIKGVGHRIVAGGEHYAESVRITPAVLADIAELGHFAPLHNPVQAKYADIFSRLMPWAVQVAVFDTAFHQSMPPENFLYSIPYDYYQRFGARKYGAHGTSVRYVTQRAAQLFEANKLIVMHLGSGSSVTAVQNGQVIDTSMGFTPLAGVTMGTRSGDIDPSLLAYLMDQLDLQDIHQLIAILNQKSGLLGLSQLSADQRDLEAVEAENPQAKLALMIYANRVAKYVGSFAAAMNGVDALVFTGGVGENGGEMRAKIMAYLGFLGAFINPLKNQTRGREIDLSAPEATIATWVIPTNEELMIARDVQAQLL